MLQDLKLEQSNKVFEKASDQLEIFLPKAHKEKKSRGSLRSIGTTLSTILKNDAALSKNSLYGALQAISQTVHSTQEMPLNSLLADISRLTAGELPKSVQNLVGHLLNDNEDFGLPELEKRDAVEVERGEDLELQEIWQMLQAAQQSLNMLGEDRKKLLLDESSHAVESKELELAEEDVKEQMQEAWQLLGSIDTEQKTPVLETEKSRPRQKRGQHLLKSQEDNRKTVEDLLKQLQEDQNSDGDFSTKNKLALLLFKFLRALYEIFGLSLIKNKHALVSIKKNFMSFMQSGGNNKAEERDKFLSPKAKTSPLLCGGMSEMVQVAFL